MGVIYSRPELRADELREIPSVVKDLEFFVQPKYRVARDKPGSGNTKNIGAVNDTSSLIDGEGPFAPLGEEVFDDYWMYYLTKDMARAVDLKEAPYNSLDKYLEYKKNLP